MMAQALGSDGLLSQSPSNQPSPVLPRFQSPPFDRDTPPPPPPKPGNDPSRRGTPQSGPPLPPPPPSAAVDAPQISQSRQYGDGENLTQDRVMPEYAPLPPPSLEEGWIPDILKDKSTQDLVHVLNTSSLLASLANSHPSYAASVEPIESQLSQNIALSQRVLQLESHITSLRESTQALLLQNQSLELSWRKKQSEMDTALAPWSPKVLYQRLGAGIGEQEGVCRAVEESFIEAHGDEGLAGDRETNEWIKRIREGVEVLEKRREGRARWDEGRVGGWR